MSTEGPVVRNDNLVFQNNGDIESTIEHRLKCRYGRGVFVQDAFEASNEQIVVKLGTSYPKDVSDRRIRDKVLRFINLGDIATLYAKPTEEGYFRIELPERAELQEGARARRKEIVDQLDWSMAKVIYEDVYQLNPVRNQLNSLIQIVRWLQKEPELSVKRIDDIQRTENTREYLQVLDGLGFVKLDEEHVHPGRKLEAAEIEAAERSGSKDLDIEEYEKIAIGALIRDGYNVLRDQLGLRMLNHFPKFANAYYYSAIQRDSPDIWLDKSALLTNLQDEWSEDVDPLQLDDKLRKLAEVDIVETDDEYVKGDKDIFEAVSRDARSLAIAD